MEDFSDLILSSLRQVIDSSHLTLSQEHLNLPQDRNMGDFAFATFPLAKTLKLSPPKIAQDLKEKLDQNPEIQKNFTLSADGPYLNFKIKSDVLFSTLLPQILSEQNRFGSKEKNSRGTWILEYSSPNVAKPFQIYHLRPTIHGAALDRIGRYRGYHIISINHLGDWGTQYGKLAIAFEFFGDELPEKPSMEELVNIYVKIHEEIAKNPTLEDRAREAFAKLEQGDPEMTALWEKCREISIEAFQKIYDQLQVKFDHIWGESYYQKQLDPLLEKLKKKKIAVESEGAWVIPLASESEPDLPPCIVQKSDGATIYATRDLAAAIYREEKFHFDKMTYIVGREQSLHFKQIFMSLEKMGYAWVSKCEHLPTGLYRFKDAKMSTRKGNFVTLEDMIDLAKEKVDLVIRERDSDSTLDEEIKNQIAWGAVCFHDLKSDPSKDVEFDMERVVSFDGETGPYLQYAHTRCLGIFRKAKSQEISYSRESAISHEKNSKLHQILQHPTELDLVKTLGTFPLELEKVLKNRKASHLATYLLQVTKAFNAFYRDCPVLSSNQELTQARLVLVEASQKILSQGLELLGIPLPEKM